MKSLSRCGSFLAFGVFAFSSLLPSFSFADGVGAGGGGDAKTEMRIDEIRADILKWIFDGGARGLSLHSNLTYESYVSGMEKVLTRNSVVIGAVSLAEESTTEDEELKVVVNGQPKACRGFVSKKDGSAHVLCNVERFSAATPAEQYRLIHHEYAGLAGVEKNEGAASDYRISSQLTDYLTQETVLRLAVKKQAPARKETVTRIKCYNACKDCDDDYGQQNKGKTIFEVTHVRRALSGGVYDLDFSSNEFFNLEGHSISSKKSAEDGFWVYSFDTGERTYTRSYRDGASFRRVAVSGALRLNAKDPSNSTMIIHTKREQCGSWGDPALVIGDWCVSGFDGRGEFTHNINVSCTIR